MFYVRGFYDVGIIIIVVRAIDIVSISSGDISSYKIRNIAGANHCCLLFRDSACTSRIEHPGSADINPVTEFMINGEVYIVATVIFIWKPFSIVDAAFGKLTVTLGKSIRYPTGCLSDCFLCHKFNSHRTSASHFHFIFPSCGCTEDADTFFVFQYITHILIVAFYRKLPAFDACIIIA